MKSLLTTSHHTQDARNREQDLSRLAAIGQMSAGIAHEVKNPLTAVRGFLQLLAEDTPHRYLEVAKSELDRALSTLENLLYVSKPDLDDEPYMEVSLASEIQSLLYLFQDKSYDVCVETHLHDTDVLFYGKRNQIKKALFNLIKNAFEAIPGEGRITIGHERVGERIQITISDTGTGIPTDQLPLLGTPFFSTKSDGTGMGLTQVFSTIYQHNGQIHVSSEAGKGTTFMLDFPSESRSPMEAITMDTKYVEGQTFEQFFETNSDVFNKLLKQQSMELMNNLEETKLGRDFVLPTAQTIVRLLNQHNEHGLILEAKKNGKTWARHDLSMILKLEWLQTLRKLYWELLTSHAIQSGYDVKQFFTVGEKIHFFLDSYRNHFSASFTEYKNEYIKSQTDLINDLSVPVIPIIASTAILPIIGAVDTHRAKLIQENVLGNISELRLKRLIIDMSGVAFMDTAVVSHMFRIIEGINLLGCKAILTGLRPEIVNTMIELGISLTDRVETRGTLQQALEEAHLVVTQ